MSDDERIPQTRDEILAEEQRLKAEYGQLFDDLLAKFFADDPMRINFEVNRDEYSPEIRTILPRLHECQSEYDAQRVIHEEFTRWFGDPGPEAHYANVASQVWKRWQVFKNKEN